LNVDRGKHECNVNKNVHIVPTKQNAETWYKHRFHLKVPYFICIT